MIMQFLNRLLGRTNRLEDRIAELEAQLNVSTEGSDMSNVIEKPEFRIRRAHANWCFPYELEITEFAYQTQADEIEQFITLVEQQCSRDFAKAVLPSFKAELGNARLEVERCAKRREAMAKGEERKLPPPTPIDDMMLTKAQDEILTQVELHYGSANAAFSRLRNYADRDASGDRTEFVRHGLNSLRRPSTTLTDRVLPWFRPHTNWANERMRYLEINGLIAA